jgi:hypothetical protein
MEELKRQAEEAFDNPAQQEVYDLELAERWEAETKRRVALIAEFFNEPWPNSEMGWLRLIFLICAAFEAPGFQSRRPGASKKWDRLANLKLFADVMSVVAKLKIPSEYAAVKHIVTNPAKFLNRYSKYKDKVGVTTLYRQFVRANQEFEKNDRALRDAGEDPTDRWGRVMSRDDVIQSKINFYSAEASRRDIAQNQRPRKMRN